MVIIFTLCILYYLEIWGIPENSIFLFYISSYGVLKTDK